MDLLIAVSQGRSLLGDTPEDECPKNVSETFPDISNQVSIHKCQNNRLPVINKDIESTHELHECRCMSVIGMKDSGVDSFKEKLSHRCSYGQQANQLLQTDCDHDHGYSQTCDECKYEVNAKLEETVQRSSLMSNGHLSLSLCAPSEKQTSVKRMVSFSDINQEDEENGVTAPVLDKPKQSLLLRLFESKLFNMSIAIQYLFNSKEPGVLSYLGKLFHHVRLSANVQFAWLDIIVERS